MSISRGWNWLNDESDERTEEQRELIKPTLDALAAEWSAIQTEIEYEGFRRQARYEDGDDGPECDDEGCWPKQPCAECKAAAKAERAREAVREVRLEVIEGMLEKYGARMMRPYEHWNEDERWMEYQERDRD